MASDAITSQVDNHYSEEIDRLLIKMIDEVRELYHLIKNHPGNVSAKFANEFVPDFVKLYDLTCDYLETNHMKDTEKDKEIRETISQTIYYLDGVSCNNGHKININKENINQGIQLFRKYKKYLHREGIMYVH